KQAQDQHERARQEMQRRIDEIQGNIKQGRISDAIDLAQQTLGTFGPDPNVTQLLQVATSKQAERKKKENQDRQMAAAQTLVDAGNFAGATQVLNQAMATQIFERSDPRVQSQLRAIEQLSKSAKPRPVPESRPQSTSPIPGGIPAAGGKNPEPVVRRDTPPPETGTSMFSATMVLGSQSAGTTAKPPPAPRPDRAQKDDRLPRESFPAPRAAVPGKAAGAKAAASVAGGKPAENLFAAAPATVDQSVPRAAKRPFIPPEALAQIQTIIRKPAALAGLGAALIVILIIAAVAGRPKGPSENEKKIRAQAALLWNNHQFEQSEQAWRQLEQLHGFYGKEATGQISQIEEKRGSEKRRFDEGERFLKEEKNYPAASQALEKVIGMTLWLAEEARAELAAALALSSTQDIHVQEKLHFDQGETSFRGGDYENARKEFQTALDLKVPDSTIRPQAETYLKKMRQAADTKKLYGTALADIKGENWAQAQQQLQEVVNRKGPQSAEAKQRLS